ncbi:MAG: DUF2878 family protein [Deltaproteobacteria bacterium]|nr:DUF2878 family protein [Deltaproteobacteria bacterium]
MHFVNLANFFKGIAYFACFYATWFILASSSSFNYKLPLQAMTLAVFSLVFHRNKIVHSVVAGLFAAFVDNILVKFFVGIYRESTTFGPPAWLIFMWILFFGFLFNSIAFCSMPAGLLVPIFGLGGYFAGFYLIKNGSLVADTTISVGFLWSFYGILYWVFKRYLCK